MYRGATKDSWQATSPIRSCHAQYKRARPARTFVQGWCRSTDVGRHASRRATRYIIIGVAIAWCGAVPIASTLVIHPPAVWVTTEQKRGTSLVTWPMYASQVSELLWFPTYELILAAVLVSVCLVGEGGRVVTLRHTLHHCSRPVFIYTSVPQLKRRTNGILVEPLVNEDCKK